jgi:hypothetical protein
MAGITVHVSIGFKERFSIGIINGCGSKGYCGLSYRLQCCLLGLLYKYYMGTKVVVIEYLWSCRLSLGSQKTIYKGSNNLNCDFESEYY